MYSPTLVFCKKRMPPVIKNIVKMIVIMFDCKGVIVCDKMEELKIPLVLKIIDENVDGNAENKRFNPIEAINLFALNFAIKKEKNPVMIIERIMVKIKLNIIEDVNSKNAKNKKAEKLTIPSRKSARLPVNSE